MKRQQGMWEDIPSQRAIGGWGSTMGILHRHGFWEAFLVDVMTEESGGAKNNKSIPGMQ